MESKAVFIRTIPDSLLAQDVPGSSFHFMLSMHALDTLLGCVASS